MNDPHAPLPAPPTLEILPARPARSPRWRHVREAYLREHPRCAACADDVAPTPGTLDVHHVVPFDRVLRAGRADLELDFRNLITLCEGEDHHHLVLGHLGDWDSYDPHVRDDVARSDCHGRSRAAIEQLTWWLARRATRPRPYARLSFEQRTELRARLDELYPLAPPSLALSPT